MRYSKDMRLLPFILLLFFISLLFPHLIFAQNKVGINIAARHKEYDQAADIVGPGGWIMLLGSPGNADELTPYLSKQNDTNLILRGHCPSDPLGPDAQKNKKFALAWAATLGGLDTVNRKLYFMPWNEPNMTRECGGLGNDFDANNTQCAPFVRDYIAELRRYIDDPQLGNLKGKVALLSPMLNQHHANFDAFVNVLGSSFFDQFAAISMNLYDNQTCGGPLCQGDAHRNAAKFEEILNKMSTSKDAFAVETGIVDLSGTCPPGVTDCPMYNDTQMKPFIESAWTKSWSRSSRLRMFSPLSYNPEINPASWIYGSKTGEYMQSIRNNSAVETTSGFDQKVFLAWRQQKVNNGELIQCPGTTNAFAPSAEYCGFCSGGGAKGETQKVNISYYDTQYEGQVYKLKLKNVPVSNDPLTLKLTVKEGTLQHPDPPWEVTDAAWGNAREVLKPYDFIPVANDLPPPPLTDYIFAPVCRVETTLIGTKEGADSPGKTEKIREDLKDKVKLQVDDKFFKNPGDVYPLSYGRGRFIQAAFVSNQPLANKPIELIAPAQPDTKPMSLSASTCPQIPFEYLKNAVDVTSGGEIDFTGSGFVDSLKKFIDDFFGKLFPKQTQDLEIYFIWRQLKPMAKQIHDVYTDEQTGFARAMLPAGQNVVTHGETLARITPPAGSELERASSVLGEALGDTTNKRCQGKEVCQPDAFQNVDTVLPHRMLCSFLPAGVKERLTLGCDDTTRSGPLSCMDRNTSFKRLNSVIQPCNPNVTFSWESLTGATRYKVDFQPVRYDSGGKPIDNDADWHPKPDRFVTGLTDTINIGDAFGGQYKEYWWRVLAMDAVECSTQVRAQTSETSPNASGFTDRGIIHLSCNR